MTNDSAVILPAAGRSVSETAPTPMLMTTKQTAVALQVSERTVFNLCKAGDLSPVRIRGSLRFDRRDIENMIENAKQKSRRLPPTAETIGCNNYDSTEQ